MNMYNFNFPESIMRRENLGYLKAATTFLFDMLHNDPRVCVPPVSANERYEYDLYQARIRCWYSIGFGYCNVYHRKLNFLEHQVLGASR